MMFKQVSLVMAKFEATFDSGVDKCSRLDGAIKSYMCARGTLLDEKGRRLEPGAFNPVRVNTRSPKPITDLRSTPFCCLVKLSKSFDGDLDLVFKPIAGIIQQKNPYLTRLIAGHFQPLLGDDLFSAAFYVHYRSSYSPLNPLLHIDHFDSPSVTVEDMGSLRKTEAFILSVCAPHMGTQVVKQQGISIHMDPDSYRRKTDVDASLGGESYSQRVQSEASKLLRLKSLTPGIIYKMPGDCLHRSPQGTGPRLFIAAFLFPLDHPFHHSIIPHHILKPNGRSFI